MTYSPHKDIWIGVLWFGLIGTALIWTFFTDEFLLLSISIIALLAALWVWFTTRYHVEERDLIIRSGPFKKSIDIHDIEQIRLIRSIKLSPALSITRLEITYGYDLQVVRVAPADKSLFVKQLMSINPDIEFE
ncbi:PDZ domain-containing secreted protein [Alkalibacillus flavidus]|uniref:PDZ domain-containing secreted protein n=1 Tax=Alkalibacillus flavidus TaxID=546021 RepID=A0ABV2KZY0_9BACI